MLCRSDNTATDHLIRLLGGPAAINRTLAEVGIASPRVSRTCHEIIAHYYGLPGSATLEELDAFVAEHPASSAFDERLKGEQRDQASPREMTALLCRLTTPELIRPESTRRLMKIMAANRTGDARMRAGVPTGAWVATKTGTLGPHVAHDVGYMGWDSHQIAISCFTWSHAPKHAEALIAQAAQLVFARLTMATEGSPPG